MWKQLWNWKIGGGWRNFEVHARKSLYCHQGTGGRNMDVKGDSGETSERKKESWRESLHLLREHLNDH